MDFEDIISWRYVFIYIICVYIYMIIDLLVVYRTLWNPPHQTSANIDKRIGHTCGYQALGMGWYGSSTFSGAGD